MEKLVLPRPEVAVRTRWLVLAIATLAAAVLRLAFIDNPSLWVDEAFTRDAVMGSFGGVWEHARTVEANPPLFFWIEWLLGGTSAAAMRLVPAFALIAAVPVSFFALRRFIGERAALAAAVVVAVSPELVEFAVNARAYGLFVLFALLSVWAFGDALEGASWRALGLWAVAAIACVWTHYFGVFLVAAEGLLLLVRWPRRSLVAGAAVVVAALPLLTLVSKQATDERASFIAKRSLASRLEQTVREFAMGANVPVAALEAAGIVVLGVAFLAGLVFAIRDERARPLVVLTALTAAAPLVLAIVGVQDRWFARNMLALLPLSAGIASLALVRARALPLALYCTLALIAGEWVLNDWHYQNADWRTAIEETQKVDPAAAVLAFTPLSGPVAQAYLGRPVATSDVRARSAWLVVEPYRAAGHRDLGPQPLELPAIPGFTAEPERIIRGFRLVHLRAQGAHAIAPGAVPGAVAFGPPR